MIITGPWEAHAGLDYNVVMLPNENTDNASIQAATPELANCVARVPDMVHALTVAADQFRFYQREHDAKAAVAVEAGDEPAAAAARSKAEVNGIYAGAIDSILAGALGITGATFQMQFLIWSEEHHAWRRPGRHGYTGQIREAGFYPRQVADEIVRGANIAGFNEIAIPAPLGIPS